MSRWNHRRNSIVPFVLVVAATAAPLACSKAAQPPPATPISVAPGTGGPIYATAEPATAPTAAPTPTAPIGNPPPPTPPSK